jgi:DNA-binding XRE family transcriptional regulator
MKKKMSERTFKSDSDGGNILRRRYLSDDPELAHMVAAYRVNLEIAQQLYDLRMEAGYTQEKLAKLVGTTPSVISRLENADYEGHSLSMLKRIAAALGKRIVITFVDAKFSRAV